MDILAKNIYFLAHPEMSVRLPPPRVLFLLFTREREGFSHPAECCGHWVALGLRAGRFRFSLGVDGPEEVCGPGEFVVCPPGVELRREALGRILFFYIGFRWEKKLAFAWRGKFAPLDRVRMESTLAHLEKVPPHPDGEGEWTDHLMLDLFQQCRHERGMEHSAERGTGDRLMLRAAERIGKNPALPLEIVAAEMRMNPPQFSRRFRAAFGSGPAAWRTQIRMSLARRLLLETAHSLEEIAESCGYENAFYFSRVFHAEIGMPPSHFRRRLRV